MDNINLNKTVYNKEKLKRVVNTDFSEFIPKGLSIGVDEFFSYYNEIFYDIPLEGTNSHRYLIDRSKDYLGDSESEEIIQLRNRILELELEVLELEASNKEHPVFKNGSILKDPNVKGRYWYMDRGVKRNIIGNEILVTIIRSQNQSLNQIPDKEIKIDNYTQFVPNAIISQIETGPAFNYNDFSGKERDTRKNLSGISEQTEKIRNDISISNTTPRV
jgi:hypothetical protein